MGLLNLAARAGLFCLAFFALNCSASTPPPVEAFARMPHIRNVALSPDGLRLVAVMNADERSSVAVLDREKSLTWQPVFGFTPEHSRLTWCKWANRTRILCGTEAAHGANRIQHQSTRIIALDSDGSYLKPLVSNVSAARFRDRVLDWTPHDPETVLIEVDDNNNGLPSVYELNLYNGRRLARVPERAPIRSYWGDGSGAIRLSFGYELGSTEFLYFARTMHERGWRPLVKVKAIAAGEPLQPIALVAGTNKAYASGSYEGRASLWEIDLDDRQGPQLVFSLPHADVDTPILSSDGRLLGMRYDVDEPYVYYTDQRRRALVESVDQQHPTKFNYIVDATGDEKVYVIHSFSDVDAGTYFVLDTTTNRLEKLGSAYPELDQQQLGRMRSIGYPASDGTAIPGYLTVPPGSPERNLPLIVMPHDGPASRDTREFSFLRAFLVSRGYAVLQINFRGSTGRGARWRDAIDLDWGLAYSDITDGTRWAVKQGIADPQRVAIVGWGFGGYVAQLSSIRNPELYRASVSIAGFSDLIGMLKDAALQSNSRALRQTMGASRDKLRADSPHYNVKDVRIPMLLIHGDNDYRVQVTQAAHMQYQLERERKEHVAWVVPGANHEFDRKSDRVFLLTEVEKFLLEHLGKL